MFIAILSMLYRLRYVRKRRRREASIRDDGRPVSKFMIRKGRVVEVSQLSRPPSIVSRHSSARNRVSVYSKFFHGVRSSNSSMCGSPRHWPVSMYSTQSRRYVPWSQRQSTLSGHQHSIPSPGIKGQNKEQWNESKDTLPCVAQQPLHSITDSIAGAHQIGKLYSASTKVSGTPWSSRGVFGGTATPSLDLEIVLDAPTKTSLTPKVPLPRSLGGSSTLPVPALAASAKVTAKSLPTLSTSGMDKSLSRQISIVPSMQDGANTDTTYSDTCGDDDGHAGSSRSYAKTSPSDSFGFVPCSPMTRPWTSRGPHETKYNRPRESISSLRTFNSDISDFYTVGHATPVTLPADPRMSPLARPPVLKRPLSKYRVPVENRYAKALPSLPSTSHIQKSPEVGSSPSCLDSRPKSIDTVKLEMNRSRPQIVYRKGHGHREVTDSGGGVDGR